MQKLKFDKFIANKIDSHQLNNLKGGTCTGGGSSMTGYEHVIHDNGTHSYRLVYATWTSDESINGVTLKNGEGVEKGNWFQINIA
jgi:natural product precursor